MASARKSSTPASAAIAAAVSGLSPVIITVRRPMARNMWKRSLSPPFTTSLRCTTPSTRAPSDTASGVPPDLAMVATACSTSGGMRPPSVATCRAMASAAPLRITRPFRSHPLMRVWAENGTNCASGRASSRARRPCFSLASTMIDRPSGVSSARLASWAASASCSTRTPDAGRNSVAMRLPSVMVPVLSRRIVSTSPDASTARPLIGITLWRISRSMPAMPMADSRPPMVVGIRQTSRATITVTEKLIPE